MSIAAEVRGPGAFLLTVTDGGRIVVRVTRAVLHRPANAAPPDDPGACGADCVPLLR